MSIARHAPAVRSFPEPSETSRAASVTGPTIWAVASGKGGVGKSVVSASLAVGLAQSGPRVVVVDLDLGGANQHSLFGCERAPHTLNDFLRGRVKTLDEALTDTSVSGVRLLSGARGALDIANACHAQKTKILRALGKIDAAHVVLDLGAGSHFHTLDAFLAADRRVLVVTPEETAVENAYHFLKAAFFRALREVARKPEIHDVLKQAVAEARRSGATPRELVDAVSHADPEIGARLHERLSDFDVDLVVNRVDDLDDRDPAVEIAAAGRAQLGANLRRAAVLMTDSSVPAALERGVPVMQLFPGSRFCRDVHGLVDRLVEEPRRSLVVVKPPPALAAEPALPTAPELPEFDGQSPGHYLRRCREQRGLALMQIHERTRIALHHLESIEAERFEALPPEVYVRAYIQQIATELGLGEADVQPLVRCVLECAAIERDAPAAAPAAPSSRPTRAPEPRPVPERVVEASFDRIPAHPVPASPPPTVDELFAMLGDDPDFAGLEA